MFNWLKNKSKPYSPDVKIMLSKVKYKNAEFYMDIHENETVIVMRSPTICADTKQDTFIYSWRAIKDFNLKDEKQFKKDMMALVLQQESHEALEFFRYGEVKTFDPHNEYKNITTTIHWNDK